MGRNTEKSEKASELSTEHMDALLNNIHVQVWYVTDDHTYGAVNKAHADFNGCNIEDLVFKNMYDIFAKEVVDVWLEGNRKVFSTGKIIHTEEWIPHVSGEQRLLSITKSPKLRDDGSVEYVVCSAQDITERKRGGAKTAQDGTTVIFRLRCERSIPLPISELHSPSFCPQFPVKNPKAIVMHQMKTHIHR